MATEKIKKKTRVIAIIAAAAVLVIAVIGFLFMTKGLNVKSYRISLEEGKKYFLENDFENAVLAYQAAVEANPESEEAALGLTTSYMEIKDYTNAKSVIRRFLGKYESGELTMLLNRINFLYYGIGDSASLTQEEIDQMSQAVALNKTTWNEFGELTFNAYKKRYPDSKAKTNEKGTPTLTCSSVKRICYFENTETLDKGGNPKENAYPSRIELMDLGVVFNNFNEMLSYEKLKEIFEKKVEKKYDDILGCDAVFATYGDDVLVMACDKNGNILSKNAQNYVLLSAGISPKCAVNGKISDSTTGKNLKAEITITSLTDSQMEEIKLRSNDNGNYSSELSAGKYTFTIESEGYITDKTEFMIKEDQKAFKKDFALSPELYEGEIRIVLEWGSAPQDLDPYLFDDRNQRVYFGAKNLKDSKGEIASLDLDDRNGYGPETITVYRTDRNYNYIVHDHMRENSKSVQKSNATVKVYMPGKETVIIKVPQGEGNVWEVLEINNGELKIVNEMRERSTSSMNK